VAHIRNAYKNFSRKPGGRIILKIDFKEMGMGSEIIYWIQLAQDRVHWRAVMDMVMSLGFP
jgi:hypothetical protein